MKTTNSALATDGHPSTPAWIKSSTMLQEYKNNLKKTIRNRIEDVNEFWEQTDGEISRLDGLLDDVVGATTVEELATVDWSL